jgi:hypothetical protein
VECLDGNNSVVTCDCQFLWSLVFNSSTVSSNEDILKYKEIITWHLPLFCGTFQLA